jgi:hypothetical protein
MFEVAKESDRSAVILGAIRLDQALEHVLRQAMCHHPGGQDNLFDPDCPLSSFSAKIALAHRLGLIEDRMEHALHMIRRIRNDFAHSLETASVDQGSARSRISELVNDTKVWSAWNDMKAIFTQLTDSEPLADFCTSISALMSSLELQADFISLKVEHVVHMARTSNDPTHPELPPDA